MEGELLECEDELVETFEKYFERTKEHVDFMYPSLYVSLLDLSKVIKDGHVVYKEGEDPSSIMIHSYGMDASSDKNKGSFAQDERCIEEDHKASSMFLIFILLCNFPHVGFL